MGARMATEERTGRDFGTMMKQARETRGVSLRQIADATKISVTALEALERNDISCLPGGIFSRAFVRSYANEVGLDPEQTVRAFITQFPHDSVTAGSPHVPHEDNEALESRRKVAAMALQLVAIALAIIGVILYFTLWTR
jgi:cytoskeleton protein RodZ